MGKSKKQQHRQSARRDETYSRLSDPATPSFAADEQHAGKCLLDRHDLYQKAVQSPLGDMSYMLKFFRDYIGMQVPLHLREDFSGTSLISATWCKTDVRRTALGIDIDREALEWGWEHNGQAMLAGASEQLCLVEANVLDNLQQGCKPDQVLSQAEECREAQQELVKRPADIVCALNFSVFLLSSRQEVVKYFRLVKAAMNVEDGSIFVLDIMGGHAAETSIRLQRQNEVTGLLYLWEQTRFDPVRRQLTCHISLKDPQSSQVLRHAFTYHWKLWTIPEVVELLQEAGFTETNIWIRCMIGTDDADSNGQDDVENDFLDYVDVKGDSDLLAKLSKGWTAYLVAALPADNR